ncbi:acetoacetate decarboxylase family protein [Streptomyces sp. NPDC058701]|uniref:acetoacetate decarboxylase family protein n=1 Tax=Streptomyces sp. NPDC058701 TaxID=3346608 RepID=UPI00364D82C9
MPTYPPEPWHLAGQMYLSLWSVPSRALPPLPAGLRPLTLAGRALMGGAWVVYENDSVLHYSELLSAVLVRDGRRPRVTITDIWVDSGPSRDGGRELWGIPKEMAEFHMNRDQGFQAAATAGAGVLGRASFRGRLPLPGRLPLSYHVAQTLDGQLKTSPVRCRGTLTIARGDWEVPPGSELMIPARRPLLSLILRDFGLSFGSAPSSAPASRSRT